MSTKFKSQMKEVMQMAWVIFISFKVRGVEKHPILFSLALYQPLFAFYNVGK